MGDVELRSGVSYQWWYFLLIDQIENEQVIFVRAGTHADLFEWKIETIIYVLDFNTETIQASEVRRVFC